MPNPPIDPTRSEGPGKIRPDKSIEGTKNIPDKSTFESYKETAPSAPSSSSSSQISPMDLASKETISTTPNFQTLLSQTQNMRDTLGNVQNQLKTPNLKFKKSQENLLNSKLSTANDHLQAAAEKMGATVPENTQVSANANPLARYLAMVTDGQNQLVSAQEQLKKLNTDGTKLQPGDLLLIQIKLAQAQQEMEYSSILLSKTVDALKRMMDIQL
ncbi:MAG: hypothetical protein K1060chlam5_00380 [Candidatus Anoxychlamydiales bacterium]|nr:hypothetical protein [Candidatus Anoxychlamydiales bacterium]